MGTSVLLQFEFFVFPVGSLEDEGFMLREGNIAHQMLVGQDLAAEGVGLAGAEGILAADVEIWGMVCIRCGWVATGLGGAEGQFGSARAVLATLK
jgi:hypothetical protein